MAGNICEFLSGNLLIQNGFGLGQAVHLRAVQLGMQLLDDLSQACQTLRRVKLVKDTLFNVIDVLDQVVEENIDLPLNSQFKIFGLQLLHLIQAMRELSIDFVNGLLRAFGVVEKELGVLDFSLENALVAHHLCGFVSIVGDDWITSNRAKILLILAQSLGQLVCNETMGLHAV